jgi:dolichol kinase
MNDLIIISIVAVYIAIVYAVPILLYRKGRIEKRTARTIIHFFSGLSIISLFFAENKWLYLIASGAITLIVFLSRKSTPVLKHVFHSINEEQEKNYLQGPVLYGLSITYLILFSIIMNNNIIPLASALVLIISDPLAAIVGKRFGKNFFLLLSNHRTAEGSLAMLLSNSVIISLFFGFGIRAIAISFIITIIELISPSKIDDFMLPLSASILLINY